MRFAIAIEVEAPDDFDPSCLEALPSPPHQDRDQDLERWLIRRQRHGDPVVLKVVRLQVHDDPGTVFGDGQAGAAPRRQSGRPVPITETGRAMARLYGPDRIDRLSQRVDRLSERVGGKVSLGAFEALVTSVAQLCEHLGLPKPKPPEP